MSMAFCTQCGESLAPADRFCAKCGQARGAASMATAAPAASVTGAGEGMSAPPAAAPPIPLAAGLLAAAPPWRRPRPWWLILALNVATFWLYSIYWLFATWRELKTERADPTMRPVWHVLAILFVPIYGWLRFHAHMRTIREFAVAAGARTSLSAGACVLVWILTTAVSIVLSGLELAGAEAPWWAYGALLAADTGVLIWGQSALTAGWRRLPGGAAPFRVHPGEWVVVGAGGLLLVLAALGSSV